MKTFLCKGDLLVNSITNQYCLVLNVISDHEITVSVASDFYAVNPLTQTLDTLSQDNWGLAMKRYKMTYGENNDFIDDALNHNRTRSE